MQEDLQKITPPKDEINLLFEFIFKNPKFFLKRRYKKFPLQNEKFEYGVKVKNIDSKVFKGGIISNLRFYPSNSNEILSRISNKITSIGILNPGEEKEIFIDKIRTFYIGQMIAECNIASEDPNQDIVVHRNVSDNIEKYSKKNNWAEPFFIQSKSELQRDWTNYLIALLTLVTTVEGIFGLKNAVTVIVLKPILFLLNHIIIIIESLINK
jgi:hypothetical protein